MKKAIKEAAEVIASSHGSDNWEDYVKEAVYELNKNLPKGGKVQRRSRDNKRQAFQTLYVDSQEKAFLQAQCRERGFKNVNEMVRDAFMGEEEWFTP